MMDLLVANVSHVKVVLVHFYQYRLVVHSIFAF